MEKIEKEISEIKSLVEKYKCGTEICNDELTLDLLRLSSEKLLFEIAYFMAKRTAKEKIIIIKNSATVRATKKRTLNNPV
jgi:hypothetical protein